MHVTTARVRYADTDQGGVAYHARYLDWFEVGRTEMLRELGFPYARLEREDRRLLTVFEAALEYHRPARYDDLLLIESRLADVRRVRLRIDTRILRQEGGDLLCTGHIWLACVDPEGRPAPIPPRFLEVVERASGKSGAAAGVGVEANRVRG